MGNSRTDRRDQDEVKEQNYVNEMREECEARLTVKHEMSTLEKKWLLRFREGC